MMKIEIDKSKWKNVRLGDVAIEYSKRVNNPSESGFERFVGSSNIGQWDFNINSWEPTSSVTSSMKLFEPKDYLLVRRSLYASDFRERAPRASFAGVCSGDILTIRENPDYIVDGFLIGILNSPQLWKYVVANASGSITRRIKWKDLANYEFLLPPKEQQAQLAELLWAMDEVIEREVHLSYKLTSLRDTILKSVFSIDSKILKTFLNSSEIEELRPTTFSDVCNESMFGPRFSSKLYNQNGNVASLRTTDLSNFGDIDLNQMPKAMILDNKFKEHYLKADDLVITRSGTCGIAAVFEGFDIPVLPGAFLIRFRLKENTNPHYIKLFFNSIIGRAKTASLASGAVQKNLTGGALLNIKIPLPSIILQNKIVDTIQMIKLDGCKQKIKTSKSLQKSLINQIF